MTGERALAGHFETFAVVSSATVARGTPVGHEAVCGSSAVTSQSVDSSRETRRSTYLTTYLRVDIFRPMETTTTVREQILDHAITLIMLRGYNGFSYRDLSSLVGVKTSSIHYYFPSKDDLVLEAVNEYSKEVLNAIHAIDASLPADAKLNKYGKLFGRTLGDGDQICLCGMLAADIGSLPDNIRQAVQAFFKANESWLAKVLAQGLREHTLAVNSRPENAARALYAAFQGSVLASRLFHTKARLEDVEASVRIAR
ncbi:TetR family transcriptional regulator [Paraburkholderia sp. BL6665CI2N2]|nr:TetR family transcriptional regulator [Paraburkholderia sp. BL6665CI2N2]